MGDGGRRAGGGGGVGQGERGVDTASRWVSGSSCLWLRKDVCRRGKELSTFLRGPYNATKRHERATGESAVLCSVVCTSMCSATGRACALAGSSCSLCRFIAYDKGRTPLCNRCNESLRAHIGAILCAECSQNRLSRERDRIDLEPREAQLSVQLVPLRTYGQVPQKSHAKSSGKIQLGLGLGSNT